MFVSVITDYNTLYDTWHEKINYYNVSELKVLEGRVLIHDGNRIVQVPLDGKRSVLIR